MNSAAVEGFWYVDLNLWSSLKFLVTLLSSLYVFCDSIFFDQNQHRNLPFILCTPLSCKSNTILIVNPVIKKISNRSNTYFKYIGRCSRHFQWKAWRYNRHCLMSSESYALLGTFTIQHCMAPLILCTPYIHKSNTILIDKSDIKKISNWSNT